MSVESNENDVVDLGGGCDGNCVGCGVGAAAGDAQSQESTVPPEIRLARLTFLLGALVGLGLAALIGIVWPAALPVIAAGVLVVVAASAIVSVGIRRSAVRG